MFRKTANRKGWLGCAIILIAASAHAQTISPVTVDFKEKARGKVTVTNNALFPMDVIFQPVSFDLTEDGHQIFRPLDSSVHVKLSTSSFRVPPRQSFDLVYEATSDSLPGWFAIDCQMSHLPRAGDLKVVAHLIHTVYLLQKKPLQKDDFAVDKVTYDPSKQELSVLLENKSSDMGRSLGIDVLHSAKNAGANVHRGGFVVLPHSKRSVSIAWTSADEPDGVVVQFDRFKLEAKLDSTP